MFYFYFVRKSISHFICGIACVARNEDILEKIMQYIITLKIVIVSKQILNEKFALSLLFILLRIY